MSGLVKRVDELCKEQKVFLGKGCSSTIISKASKKLKIEFPYDYYEYLSKYGIISFYATQWTGLGVTGHLNVVEATLEQRKMNPRFSKDFFVLEDLAIEGIIIAADKDGHVYEVQMDNQKKIYDSLVDYLNECIKRKRK